MSAATTMLRSVSRMHQKLHMTRRFLGAATAGARTSSHRLVGEAVEKWKYRYLPITSSNLFVVSSTSLRSFQSSATVEAQRRRRGGDSAAPPVMGGGDNESHSARPTPVKDRDIFLAAAKKELDRVEAAIEPMKSCNDVFDVTRSTNDEGDQLSIRLKGSDGTFTLQIDGRNCTMNLSSPVSGVYTYVLCSRTNAWLGMDDAHIMEGMLTRDLIRICNGVPKF
mmetsp:Transcript_37531/g.82191  ORF Transcript_37531/g.82191 Transcript_37531/m.82191 type:complete len:223 (+) Transcript_37531:81-749(+)